MCCLSTLLSLCFPRLTHSLCLYTVHVGMFCMHRVHLTLEAVYGYIRRALAGGRRCCCPSCRCLCMGVKWEPSQHVAADNGFWEDSYDTSPLLTSLPSLSAVLFPLSFPSFFFSFSPPCLSLSPSSQPLPCYPLMYFLCVWPEGAGRRVICLKDRRTAPTNCYKLWQCWQQSSEEAFHHTMLLMHLFPLSRDCKSPTYA